MAQTKVKSELLEENINISGDLTVDTNTLYVDSTNNRVGIGTLTPDYPLHIVGTTNILKLQTTSDGRTQVGGYDSSDNTNFLIGSTDSTNAEFWNYKNGYIRFATNSTERMRIDSSGRVGINDTAPSFPLTIYGGSGAASYDIFRAYAWNGTSNKRVEIKIDNTETDPIAIWNTSKSGGASVEHSFQIDGSERLRIDSSGNVGIGADSPFTNLTVYGATDSRIALINSNSGTTSSDGFVMILENDSEVNFLNRESAAIKFATAGTERLRITSAGNVGIGTASPSAKMTIESGSFARLDLNLSNATGTLIADIRGLVQGTEKWRIGKTSSSSDDFAINITGTERMRIDSSGRVGIGTTTPDETLHLHRSGTNYIKITNDTTGQGGADGLFIGNFASDGSAIFWNSEVANLQFATSNTERMRITSGGDVYIKTTTLGGQGISFSGNSGTGIFNTSVTTSINIIEFKNPNGQVGRISTSGSSTSYLTSSDYRIKENVVEMTGALDRVDALKPSRFNFIADPEKTVDGFLAHEVAEVVPEAITGEKDAVDEEGNAIYQGIDQSKLVPLLVGAIQELRAEIETLKSQINP